MILVACNARWLERAGGGRVLPQAQLSAASLAALIDDKTKRLLHFSETITRNSYKIHEGTLQNLRDEGCTDEELFEAIAVTSLFNYMDRMADALGAPVEGFQEMMKQMQETSS